MNAIYRLMILAECKNGEQKSAHKSALSKKWKLGKLLSFGVTNKGFPFIVWETRNWGAINVGESRDGTEPKSKLRNDASSGVYLNTLDERMRSAERMSEEIVY